jgi:cytochrome P450
MRENLVDHFKAMASAYGDIVHYSIAGVPIYQVSHPDHAVEILSTKNSSFPKPALMRKVLSQWNGNGLVVNEGESWIRQRRLVNPAFKPQKVQTYAKSVVRRANSMVDDWLKRRHVDASRDLARLTLGVVTEALFGADVEHRMDEFIEQVAILNDEGFREMASPVMLPSWAPTSGKRRIRAATAFLRGTVDEIIAARRRSGEDRGDLLSTLLLVKDEEGDGGQMSDRQARDEAVNLLLGGNETTATALTWAVHLLSRHPDVQDEARKEALEAAGDGELDEGCLPRLKRAEMAFKEAMRLFPPVYVIPREAKEDIVVGDYAIKKGGLVQIAVAVIQRDPRWFEDPARFHPARFEAEESIRRGAYLPFGAGPRACIGRSFAMMEGTLALASVLRRCSFRPADPRKEVQTEAQVSLHPKGGLDIVVEPV